MANTVGMLLGSLCGYLFRWINRQLAIIVFLSMIVVTTFFIPYYPNFYYAIVSFIFNGIGGGAWNAAVGYWIVEMWPVGNTGMLQLLQFTFGLGTITAPLLASPYVHGESLTYENRTITIEDRKNWLKLPYAVNSFISLIGNQFNSIKLIFISNICLFLYSNSSSFIIDSIFCKSLQSKGNRS